MLFKIIIFLRYFCFKVIFKLFSLHKIIYLFVMVFKNSVKIKELLLINNINFSYYQVEPIIF